MKHQIYLYITITMSECFELSADDVYDWGSILGFGESDTVDADLKRAEARTRRTGRAEFSSLNDDPIDLEASMLISREEIIVNYNVCPKCQLETHVSDGAVCCAKCGYTQIVVSHGTNCYSASTDLDHGTSQDSFMSFKVVGKNAYGLQRSLLKTCSNYKAFSKSTNKKDMHNFVFQYEGKKIPKNVIDLAIDMFTTIKDAGYVFRGNGKRGVMGACLFYSCVVKGITKTPREIAAVMKIEERFLSSGDRVLQELNEHKIIDIPTNFDPLRHYIHQYFPALKIPAEYEEFIVALVQRAEKKNIHIKNDSRMTTKCVGAIYLLITRVKSLNHITKEDIVRECSKISKSTFVRYYSLLCVNHKKIKHVFKKYRIPMPVDWKDDHEPVGVPIIDDIPIKPKKRTAAT
jgi:transcription initiation factor TFIIIB Brf1 subunit/transcription initiation factor TFIIB